MIFGLSAQEFIAVVGAVGAGLATLIAAWKRVPPGYEVPQPPQIRYVSGDNVAEDHVHQPSHLRGGLAGQNGGPFSGNAGWYCNCGLHWHKFILPTEKDSPVKICQCGEKGIQDRWQTQLATP